MPGSAGGWCSAPGAGPDGCSGTRRRIPPGWNPLRPAPPCQGGVCVAKRPSGHRTLAKCAMARSPTLPSDVARIIQLAVAPVFLLSGVGVTLTLFTNRLARIVDRARLLEAGL